MDYKIKFDSNVQSVKHAVLREVAKLAFSNRLYDDYDKLPEEIMPGPKPTMRCCNYKEQAILKERVKIACGGDFRNPNILEVIKSACDECPLGGYTVTNACRGCIAHKCQTVCPKNTIHIDPITHTAKIDKTNCVNCGMCAKACPYSAILDMKRPCEMACKVGAISIDKDGASEINEEKCIRCGACAYQCPFGAIMDKSYMIDVIEMLKRAKKDKNYRVGVIVAPSIAGQFENVRLTQVVSGILELGFSSVIEAAKGADMVAIDESDELLEKGFLTSSCCPAFVRYIQVHKPSIADHVSHNLSPQAAIARFIKQKDPELHLVFVGPCIAKKMECQLPEVNKYVDVALTFEELLAMFAAQEVDLTTQPDGLLSGASYFGRIFARCGGLSEAVAQAIKEKGREDFILRPVAVDGMEAVKEVVAKVVSKKADFNFIEGMACSGGCIGGPAMINHEMRDKMMVEKMARTGRATINDSLNDID
ncbi:MAG TPA: monomeric [FeFe] hydrogenase [Bacilli bacterium]|nr:monomeric [FeFe] hydrogenase [Bacilli bacterium]